MSSFNLTVPCAIERVKIVEAQQASEDYTAGFDAGYFAGKLQADFEQKKWLEHQKSLMESALKDLATVQERVFQLALTHIPDLVQVAVARLFEHHQFQDEEIVTELENLIKELALARSITIEASSHDLELLKKQLNQTGASWTQAHLEWKENANLKRGEYVLESDLGMVDGRRLTRLAQLRLQLDGMTAEVKGVL